MKNLLFYKIIIFSLVFISCEEEEGVVQNTAIARVQVIHNSADLAAKSVDIYLNSSLLLDNFNFRNSSPFVEVPAGEEITISVAPSTSMSASQAIVSYNYTLEKNKKYILVANGHISPSGYIPLKNFSVEVYGLGRENANNASNTDLLVFHGSTDAPTVDVVETGVGAGTIVNNASYKDFTNYLELATANYTLEVRDETGQTTVATYQAPLSSLNLMGGAGVVVASGFLNPSNNSNGEAFGLFVALPAGGELVALPN
tara:strand:+ start:1079 stop:1849 length:771 start_codon:yes stop_codon:yes gene_type:complete